MTGVQGRSGAPGVAKTDEHREAIAAGVRSWWRSPEGLEEKARRRELARLMRLERRRENL